MTGRELIIYILENRLEDEPVFEDGKFIGFKTVEQTAIDMGVGTATVHALVNCNKIKGVYVNPALYIPIVHGQTRHIIRR